MRRVCGKFMLGGRLRRFTDMSGKLRKVYGEHREAVNFESNRQ